MLRFGYGLQGNPYQEIKDNNGNNTSNFKDNFKVQTYSGGIGYRIDDLYFDLTYQQMAYNTDMSPYTLNALEAPVASVENRRNNVFLTIGKRF